MKSKESFIKRIKRVLYFYNSRGVNKESVNNIYRKILQLKFNNK